MYVFKMKSMKNMMKMMKMKQVHDTLYISDYFTLFTHIGGPSSGEKKLTKEGRSTGTGICM